MDSDITVATLTSSAAMKGPTENDNQNHNNIDTLTRARKIIDSIRERREVLSDAVRTSRTLNGTLATTNAKNGNGATTLIQQPLGETNHQFKYDPRTQKIFQSLYERRARLLGDNTNTKKKHGLSIGGAIHNTSADGPQLQEQACLVKIDAQTECSPSLAYLNESTDTNASSLSAASTSTTREENKTLRKKDTNNVAIACALLAREPCDTADTNLPFLVSPAAATRTVRSREEIKADLMQALCDKNNSVPNSKQQQQQQRDLDVLSIEAAAEKRLVQKSELKAKEATSALIVPSDQSIIASATKVNKNGATERAAVLFDSTTPVEHVRTHSPTQLQQAPRMQSPMAFKKEWHLDIRARANCLQSLFDAASYHHQQTSKPSAVTRTISSNSVEPGESKSFTTATDTPLNGTNVHEKIIQRDVAANECETEPSNKTIADRLQSTGSIDRANAPTESSPTSICPVSTSPLKQQPMVSPIRSVQNFSDSADAATKRFGVYPGTKRIQSYDEGDAKLVLPSRTIDADISFGAPQFWLHEFSLDETQQQQYPADQQQTLTATVTRLAQSADNPTECQLDNEKDAVAASKVLQRESSPTSNTATTILSTDKSTHEIYENDNRPNHHHGDDHVDVCFVDNALVDESTRIPIAHVPQSQLAANVHVPPMQAIHFENRRANSFQESNDNERGARLESDAVSIRYSLSLDSRPIGTLKREEIDTTPRRDMPVAESREQIAALLSMSTEERQGTCGRQMEAGDDNQSTTSSLSDQSNHQYVMNPTPEPLTCIEDIADVSNFHGNPQSYAPPEDVKEEMVPPTINDHPACKVLQPSTLNVPPVIRAAASRDSSSWCSSDSERRINELLRPFRYANADESASELSESESDTLEASLLGEFDESLDGSYLHDFQEKWKKKKQEWETTRDTSRGTESQSSENRWVFASGRKPNNASKNKQVQFQDNSAIRQPQEAKRLSILMVSSKDGDELCRNNRGLYSMALSSGLDFDSPMKVRVVPLQSVTIKPPQLSPDCRCTTQGSIYDIATRSGFDLTKPWEWRTNKRYLPARGGMLDISGLTRKQMRSRTPYKLVAKPMAASRQEVAAVLPENATDHICGARGSLFLAFESTGGDESKAGSLLYIAARSEPRVNS